MCAIAGFLSPAPDPGVLDRMTDSLRHRGPDDRGVWIGDGAALGHRRLSILDLSPAGRQPMVSDRWVLVFNGEIYNHHELRGARAYRGRSDTEVLLGLLDEHGVEAVLPRLNGMFAFAAWDRRERVLWLARDRFGEKPLYYGTSRGIFFFGSELKALREHPDFDPEPDRAALALYLRLSYVPSPWSAYRAVRKLPPGCLLRAGGEPRAYYRVRGLDLTPSALPETELVDQLEARLREAVRLRMEADVPLGAFLSGGIDSSTIAALMQAQSARPVRTFTVGFIESGFNEAPHAAAVAKHLGTDHTELTVTPREAMDVIPALPAMYDEPFSDSSQIPTHLVSKLTRRHVTVSLSGDGGDELFAGYRRHLAADLIWRRWGWMPAWLRRAGGFAAGFVPGLRRWARAFARRTPAQVYLSLVTQWDKPPLLGAGPQPLLPAELPEGLPAKDALLALQVLDLEMYFPEEILVKVDRASMAAGLESRAPFLDPGVAEFALRLPGPMRIRDGVTKWALRQVLHRHVPPALVERPKQGFGIPLAAWLRGPLRDWAESLLSEAALRERGLLDPAPVRALWEAHLEGRAEAPHPIWGALMLQSWKP
jgi:asparagine synthase (glutamine-hydrolysing)